MSLLTRDLAHLPPSLSSDSMASFCRRILSAGCGYPIPPPSQAEVLQNLFGSIELGKPHSEWHHISQPSSQVWRFRSGETQKEGGPSAHLRHLFPGAQALSIAASGSNSSLMKQEAVWSAGGRTPTPFSMGRPGQQGCPSSQGRI